MRTLERLSAGDLAAVMVTYRDGLRVHQERINRLNVFPVPDGDTGTNMALTLQSVVDGLPPDPDADLDAVAKAISHGSLMGARGNSGVILSQILRGLADTLREHTETDGEALAAGLQRAADGAYRAVQKPVEGTILTVARAAADAAAAAGPGLFDVAVAAREAAAEALAHTPEQLEALAAAGVVDSGGSGLLLLFDALLHVIDGRPMPEAGEPALGNPARPTTTAEDGLSGRYEVMYLLEAADEAIPAFRDVWAGLGDSIVVVGGDGTWNCHIHTDDIGAAIEAALDAGRPRRIRVTDLFEEVEEERWVREAACQPSPPPSAAPVRCAVVAVCTGEGIRRIFASLGVHHFVPGGQSMNPSTADLLAAIDATPADEVILLPNNKNVVPVAAAAAAASSKTVRVVPTAGIQEGIAALLDYDPEGDADANAEAMAASAGRIVAGEVTQAVRPSRVEAGPIAEGDFLGIARDGIRVIAPTATEAATRLIDQLLDKDDHEIVTVIVGEGAHPADTRRITEWVKEHHPELLAEVHQGGQPLYPFLLSVE